MIFRRGEHRMWASLINSALGGSTPPPATISSAWLLSGIGWSGMTPGAGANPAALILFRPARAESDRPVRHFTDFGAYSVRSIATGQPSSMTAPDGKRKRCQGGGKPDKPPHLFHPICPRHPQATNGRVFKLPVQAGSSPVSTARLSGTHPGPNARLHRLGV
jgi:hypothetical protein